MATNSQRLVANLEEYIMVERLLISWVVENGLPHYRVYDKVTNTEIHCDEGELNETIWEMLGV